MEQAKQGGNETAPETAGYYRGAGCFSLKAAELNELLGVGRCFDMTGRNLSIGGRQARLWVVNGYAQEDLLERVIAGWQALPDLNSVTDAADFCRRYVSACDAAAEPDRDAAVMGVFAGKTLAIIDGFGGGVVLDAKQFPTRSVEEPDTSRVLRGSHDGFVENLMQNAALLRRRVRDTHLRLERLQLPERSGTDVATACIMEGDVVVLVDNSASALLLPTTILRFNEEINDYYFPPLIGTYLQIIRTLVLLLTMFITPLWYLLVKNPDTLHENLRFLLVQDEYYVPLIVQLLLVELIIDILKIASLNTPDVLSNSFSMLGALILGDFAVQARWLVPEVLVYMAFVAVANYAQHSYEMGYATKLCRILLLVLIWLWDWWGFAAGIVITLMLIVTAKPLVGKGYLYPLIPFDRKKLARLLYRRPVTKKNS